MRLSKSVGRRAVGGGDRIVYLSLSMPKKREPIKQRVVVLLTAEEPLKVECFLMSISFHKIMREEKEWRLILSQSGTVAASEDKRCIN